MIIEPPGDWATSVTKVFLVEGWTLSDYNQEVVVYHPPALRVDSNGLNRRPRLFGTVHEGLFLCLDIYCGCTALFAVLEVRPECLSSNYCWAMTQYSCVVLEDGVYVVYEARCLLFDYGCDSDVLEVRKARENGVIYRMRLPLEI